MEEAHPITSQILGNFFSPESLSLWNLFLAADIVVQGVIVLLLLASVWTWAVIFQKSLRLHRLWRNVRAFERVHRQRGSLEKLLHANGESEIMREPLKHIFVAACSVFEQWSDVKPERRTADLQQRLVHVMEAAVQSQMDKLERYMTFLASVGSSAPFVGLFGTVWGIMNSFSAIAALGNTSLVVVAPGIAEALFATALGLVAAIPASIAYNKFVADLDRLASRIEGFAKELEEMILRQISLSSAK